MQSGDPRIAAFEQRLAKLNRTLWELGDTDAHHAHGVTLSALGRDTEAIAAYRSALSIEPDHGLAHVELAMAHFRAGT